MDDSSFRHHAGACNVIPLTRTLAGDTLTPVAIGLALRRAGDLGFLFESVEGGRHLARYSLLGVHPREHLTSREGAVRSVLRDGSILTGESLPGLLKARLGAFRQPEVHGLARFAGGFVGAMGYACAASVERLPVKPDPLGLPEASLFRFDDLVIFDHAEGRVTILANAVLDEHGSEAAALLDAEDRRERLADLVATAGVVPLESGPRELPPPSADARECFLDGVERAQGHIRDGDIFQAVLSVQERIPFEGDPFDVYRQLRMTNPSPYHFYLDLGEAVAIGASPEMLARVEGRQLEVRPIAGTRPRGHDRESDEILKAELLADAKEGAEHVMLVDLGRNDVGRVSAYGSVQVVAFRKVEAYRHVMHLVSSITGQLREDVHPVDAFFATFPAGTVSGAPKLRAMEIIHDLEPVGRGLYSGAVGYFDYQGNSDTCIAIRTAIFREGLVQLQAGAGIVADSAPEREYEECCHKMASLRAALEASGPLGGPDRTGPTEVPAAVSRASVPVEVGA